MNQQKVKNVCVVVLGDIGRSPRMQYHSLSLADAGYNVNIIGYDNTKCNDSIIQHSRIHIHALTSYPSVNFPKILNYLFKTFWQIFTLFCALVFKNADYVFVQNPPAVPTLFICALYCFVVRAKFVIDWHNYAYTIMALTNGKENILVKITKWIESYFGSWADANICVTEAMKEDLALKWQIKATVLYDKPADIFHSITLKEKHDFLSRFSKEYPIFGSKNSAETAFTVLNSNNEVEMKKERPAFIISSTSWTEDEGFSILLNALKNYEAHCENENVKKLPELICVITGKGPLKSYYTRIIEDQRIKHVTILTPWLEASDYPLLLATADLGVCLHTSSSGLDLPMKVVDMFGCLLPVCAIDFNCLHELVKDKINSFTFKNTEELSSHLINWFETFPNNSYQQELEAKFKNEITKFQNVRWEKNWQRNAAPLFK